MPRANIMMPDQDRPLERTTRIAAEIGAHKRGADRDKL